MSFQTRKTFFHLRKTNSDIFDQIWGLSDPPYTEMQLQCSQGQKPSKDIGAIVHTICTFCAQRKRMLNIKSTDYID